MKSHKCIAGPMLFALATSLVPVAPHAQASLFAPRSIEQTGEYASYYAVQAHMYSDYADGLIGQPDLLRRAQPLVEAEKIWRRDDRVIAKRLDGAIQPRLFTQARLTINEAGRVESCVFSGREKADPALVDEICPVLKERLTFIPALTANGTPGKDSWMYHFTFFHRSVYGNKVPLAIQPISVSPAPMQTPDMTKQDSWPLTRLGWRDLPPVRTTRPLPMAALGTTLANGERTAGVALRSKLSDGQSCMVVVPSGDAEFDEKACAFLEKSHKPRLTPEREYETFTLPLLVIGKGKPQRVIAPLGRLADTAKPIADSSVAMAETIDRIIASEGGQKGRLRLALSLDEQGAPTDCRIMSGTGNDAADWQICMKAREQLRFIHAVDVFGRPAITRYIGWSPVFRRSN